MQKNRHNLKKEKFVMLASSLLVLSALTLTGVYVKERTRIQNENSAELSRGEETVEEATQENSSPVNVGTAVNPAVREDALEGDYGTYVGRSEEQKESTSAETKDVENVAKKDSEEVQETALSQPALSFSPEEGLVWPIVGKVLINYSMDKTVYFATLQQYKYNPALMIEATEGETITAAADGRVSNVFYDVQYGNCVSVELGDGYELTYGQLGNIELKEGDYMKVGDVIGTVAAPTKYFAEEGANVYFKLTQNGEPCDPLNQMS